MDDFRYKITKQIYDEVLKANLHQSEIASHLLIPIAFLTAATTFSFNFLFQEEISVLFKGINLIPLLFLGYIISTSFGILLFLKVIGPSFYTKDWPQHEERPASIFFFKLIGKIKTVEEWMNFFIEDPNSQNNDYLKTEDLTEKAVHDLTVESYQLSKKSYKKSKIKFISKHFFLYLCLFIFIDDISWNYWLFLYLNNYAVIIPSSCF